MSSKPKLNLATFANPASSKPAPDADVALGLIDVQRQVRTQLGDLKPLAASIGAMGVIEPIILLATPGGRYRLIAGERRFRASELAGLEKIPALIKRDLSELQIRQIQVIENNERENLTQFDEAMGVAQDAEQYGAAQAQSIWNRSEAWVSKRVAVKKYAPPVFSLLQNERCSDLEVLHSLNQLYVADAEEFNAFAQRLQAGHSVAREEVRDKVVTVKSFAKQAKVRESAPTKNKAAAPDAGVVVRAPKQQKSVDQPSKEATRQPAKINRSLQSVRSGLFELGGDSKDKFAQLQTDLSDSGLGGKEAEWVMWSGFLSAILPTLTALGDGRAQLYIKRLQREVKSQTPAQLWESMYAAKAPDAMDTQERNKVPSMPENWSF